MNEPFNPGIFGRGKINLDFDNKVEGPHIDIMQQFSDTDTIKTRVGLDGQILSQELLRSDIKITPPSDPSGLTTL